MKRIYLIWGGVLGWDGIITSAGLLGLEAHLRELGPVKSYLQQGSYRCADDMYKECAADDICVLIGYSGGSVMATRICNDPLKRKEQTVNLLVNIDGSPAGNMQPVGANVKKILNIYSPVAWIFGGGRAIGHNMVDKPISIPHLAFQSSQTVYNWIYEAVRQL